MKWGALLGITTIFTLIALYEWPQMKATEKKERAAFVTLAVTGWVISVLLLHFPDMPGPTQIIDAIYKPIGKIIEK
jgi:hypothetical protein